MCLIHKFIETIHDPCQWHWRTAAWQDCKRLCSDSVNWWYNVSTGFLFILSTICWSSILQLGHSSHLSTKPSAIRPTEVRKPPIAWLAPYTYRPRGHMQMSMRNGVTPKLTLTLTLTLTDTEGAVLTLMLGYRSLYITWQQYHNCRIVCELSLRIHICILPAIFRSVTEVHHKFFFVSVKIILKTGHNPNPFSSFKK